MQFYVFTSPNNLVYRYLYIANYFYVNKDHVIKISNQRSPRVRQHCGFEAEVVVLGRRRGVWLVGDEAFVRERHHPYSPMELPSVRPRRVS